MSNDALSVFEFSVNSNSLSASLYRWISSNASMWRAPEVLEASESHLARFSGFNVEVHYSSLARSWWMPAFACSVELLFEPISVYGRKETTELMFVSLWSHNESNALSILYSIRILFWSQRSNRGFIKPIVLKRLHQQVVLTPWSPHLS